MSKVAQQRRQGRIIRHRRVRKKIHGTAARPRLAVFRSNKHLSLQLIDDEAGRTVASASTAEAAMRRGQWRNGRRGDSPRPVAGRAGQGCRRQQVVFDRGGFLYHGRVAAVAAAAREAGLEF